MQPRDALALATPETQDLDVPTGPTDTAGGKQALAVQRGDGAHQEMGAEMPEGGPKPASCSTHTQAGVS